MYKNIILIRLYTILFHNSSLSAQIAGIQAQSDLTTPSFWQTQSPNGDMLLLRDNETSAFNSKIIRKSSSVYDLENYPTNNDTAQLQASFSSAAALLNETLYANGATITQALKNTILSECNREQFTQSKHSCGIALRRTNMRALPYSGGLFESPNDNHFDILQETAIDPGEPLIILHTSRSGKFYYVQMRNYRGWIAAKDIIKTSADIWYQFLKPTRFLVVTANRFALPNGTETLLYQMGAKIPVLAEDDHTYTVAIPSANPNAMYAKVAKTAPVHYGFLPYTQNVLIEQSFKFLNDPYGWGGLKNSVDCSSFIADIYRTVGIELPRNADDQETTAGSYTDMRKMSATERQQHFASLKSGDVLFIDGHTMLFLGMYNSRPFIIHSLSSHTNHYANDAKEKIRTMQVVVSDLSIRRYSGLTFAEAMTGTMHYQ